MINPRSHEVLAGRGSTKRRVPFLGLQDVDDDPFTDGVASSTMANHEGGATQWIEVRAPD
jgi:hypothetical protein